MDDGCIVDAYATLCRLYGNSTAAALSGLSALCYPAGSVCEHTDNSARIATRQVRSDSLGAYTGDHRRRLLSRLRRQAVKAQALRGRQQGESAACERVRTRGCSRALAPVLFSSAASPRPCRRQQWRAPNTHQCLVTPASTTKARTSASCFEHMAVCADVEFVSDWMTSDSGL